MKYFIRRLSYFLSLTGVIFVMFSYFYYYQTEHKFTIHQKIDYLILGDSHVQNGFDAEKHLPNSINLSNSAEAYFYCYCKLKALIDKEIKIENVILSYGPHNLTTTIDTIWVLDNENFLSKSRGYYPFMRFNDVSEFITKAKFSKFIAIKLIPEVFYQSIYSLERQLLIKKLPYLGGFEPNLNQLSIIASDTTNNGPIAASNISDIQVFYLEKIVDLCKSQKIKLFLLNTPLFYGTNVTQPKLKDKDFVILDYGNRFKGQIEYFADKVHLNAKGADVFSTMLANDLNKFSTK